MSEYVMQPHKWAKVGDKVIYLGVVGRVLGLRHIFNGEPALDLEDIENPEMTTFARESACEPYHDSPDL